MVEVGGSNPPGPTKQKRSTTAYSLIVELYWVASDQSLTIEKMLKDSNWPRCAKVSSLTPKLAAANRHHKYL
jgi:hypothetical protein